ncbi:hypothetical protein ACRARG_15335 [Pseudooceanicola sp. C21-150M6]|uniref:hypothetical protein n=1 Tax=Pseudooceanicola sp. C21-150M6 TaxID=3434355 RepID=UPI003D7F1E94
MTRSLDNLQARAARVGTLYAEAFGIERDAAFYIGKLTEETGELVAAHLKLAGLARTEGEDDATLRRQQEDEAADLFGFLLLFADWQGIDLAQAFDRKWGRYLDRDDTARPGRD